MNIKDWEAVISCRSFSGERIIDARMKFTADIVCPSCKKHDSMETSGHLLGAHLSFPENIKAELAGLVMARECEFCGVAFSPVPKVSRKGFEKEVLRRVTPEWRDSEIKKLEAQAEEKWKSFSKA